MGNISRMRGCNLETTHSRVGVVSRGLPGGRVLVVRAVTFSHLFGALPAILTHFKNAKWKPVTIAPYCWKI